MEAYVDAVEKEMEFRRGFLAGTTVDTIFFGGGTPSLYHPGVLQRLIDKARSLWEINGEAEITAEINPDDATGEYISQLAATDVNRISFGVQSFVERDLHLLGRRHTAGQAAEAVQRARNAGFDNISIDLIYGIPGASIRDLDNNILSALALGVDHISAYHMIIEPGTQFAKLVDSGAMSQIDESDSEMQYLLIHNTLANAGFCHYEISNFARTPELRSRHNCNYWCGETYLGLGPSAHSYDGDQRSFVVSSLEDYLQGVGTDSIYGREILTKTDKYNEFIMVSLRSCCGIRRDVMTEKFGIEALLCFEESARDLVQEGLLIRENNEYKIPYEKLMISDSIIRELFRDPDED